MTTSQKSPTLSTAQESLLQAASLPAPAAGAFVFGVFTPGAAQPYGKSGSAALGLTGASATASTTQTLAGAAQLSSGTTLVNAANANDAVKLPPAVAGTAPVVVVTVGSTATPQIFPGIAGDKIDGGSAGASVTLTAAHRGATFYCAVSGNWVSSLFGAVSS